MRAYLPAYDLRAPATLREALSLLAGAPDALAPVRGRHGSHGAARGREAAGSAVPRSVEAVGAPRHRGRRRDDLARRAHDLHRGDAQRRPPDGVSAPVPRGCGNRRRRDAEQGHARRQHRERVAGRRHAAGAARVSRGARARLRTRDAASRLRPVSSRLQGDGSGAGRAHRAHPPSAPAGAVASVPTGRSAPGARRRSPRSVSPSSPSATPAATSFARSGSPPTAWHRSSRAV